MPRLVTAYGCSFKCGRRVETVKKRVVEHESRCFHNPARRACQTCLHFKVDSDTVYNPYHGGNPGSTDYDVKFHYCAASEDIDLRGKLVCDCPLWVMKS